MFPINNLINSKLEFKSEVINLASEATTYLKNFKWCKEIINGWLSSEFGYIFCVFYFEIIPEESSKADKYIWIIVGDIPPAYIDIISAPTIQEAIICYCAIMEDWVNAVNDGNSVEECYPINVPATIEYADMLKTRIELIKNDLLPNLDSSLRSE